MTLEHARMRMVSKPWGRKNLAPWSATPSADETIGEIWFERGRETDQTPSLLLKLLFTTEPLSIQVHPNDTMAQAMGLPNGKTEAWYVLDAEPDAKVALGLKHSASSSQLRTAIEDRSIAGMMRWQRVKKDNFVFVPAGTIHAIGPGLVLAEIQQRSDTTFRLFDYERSRGLQVEEAIGAAHPGQSQPQAIPRSLTKARMLFVANPYFVLERVILKPHSVWRLKANQETWLLSIAGDAVVDDLDLEVGRAMYLDDARAEIAVGPEGLTALVAYSASEVSSDLLTEVSELIGPSLAARTLAAASHQVIRS